MKAVIFDMDGVLINTESHHMVIEHQIFRDLGLEITEEEREPFIGYAADEMWSRVIAHYKLDHSPNDLLNLNNERIIEYFTSQADIEMIPGVNRVLQWIEDRGIPLAVASSSSRIVMDVLLEQAGLDKYFKIRVGGQDVEKSKPAPFIYLHTAGLLEVEPGECVVIEDSTNGIRAAKSAGMYCIGYKGVGFHGQDQSMADETIAEYDELIPLLTPLFSVGKSPM
ncbi:MAG TPA: HAD family phosphatase [Membranihabitans sp.]|nr:HAD family phosphatase [Membranihabitans sp.]